MIGFLETEFHGNSDLYIRSELAGGLLTVLEGILS